MKVDLEWSDEEVLRAPSRLDTQFVFRRMTEATLREVEEGNPEVILDVGCGRGMDALRLCGEGRLVVGLEPSRVMLERAKEQGAGGKVLLVQGTAEQPPFQMAVFDSIMCKGALDHFYDPALSVAGLSRSLKPGGRMVVAVANFEGLSSRLTRILSLAMRAVKRKQGDGRKFWDPPEDHLCVFHYANLGRLMVGPLVLEKMEGISIMWGFPYWGSLLERLPRGMALVILDMSGRVAAKLPFLGDVIVAVARR